MRRILLVSLAAVVALAAMVGIGKATSGPAPRHLEVMFPRTTSLYEGAQVKVLGVRVGTVDSIEVEGTAVRVSMSYDPAVKLPDDVHAVIVPPSVVGDRFIQLAPAYTGGAVLADDAQLPLERSSVPLELDDTYRALDQVAVGLGPQGANKDGALSRLISAGADNIRGRGRLLNTTIRSFADALTTLADGSDDAAGATTNLARLNKRLAGSDATIRRLVAALVRVSTTLGGQGTQIVDAVTTLDDALGRVASFTRENRRNLGSDLDQLTSVTTALHRHIADLEEIADLAPVGLVNLMKTYVPRNWDPTQPFATAVEGRTGSQNLHAVLLQDLDNEMGYLVSALCANLPAQAAGQLAPLCTALTAAGGDLGSVLAQVYHQGNPPLPALPEKGAGR